MDRVEEAALGAGEEPRAGRSSASRMARPSDSRGSDNNWIKSNTEGLQVETLGQVQGKGSLQIPADTRASDSASDKGEDSATYGTSHPLEVKDEEAREPPISSNLAGQATEVTLAPLPSSCAENQQLELPPDEVPGSLPEKSSLTYNGEEGDLEEGSCSSSEEDDVEGVQKRQSWGPCPSPAAEREEAEKGSGEGAWLTLNNCLLGALVLLCVGFVLFSAPMENLDQRDLGAEEKQSQILDELRDWLKWHAQDSPRDADSLQAINRLLDKLSRENQEIGLLRVQLQAQKEELLTLLKKSNDENDSMESQQQNLLEENLHLRESLLHEETAHLSAQNELQALKEKLQVLEQTTLESRNLVNESLNLENRLDAEGQQIDDDSLRLEETLVAESQMLRQELDKQRMLVASIKHDFDLSSQPGSSETEGESEQQKEMLKKWRNKLALELQRSESWERSYAKKKAKSRGSKLNPGIHVENLADPSNTSAAAFERVAVPHSALKGPIPDERKNPNKSWEQKKSKHGEGRQGQKHLLQGEREEEQDMKPRKKSEWKEGTEGEEGDHQVEWENPGDGFHSHRQREAERESRHGHHNHNKLWKKLSSHQYRVPEGCTGIPDCARKEGLDLFHTELEPVKKQDFQQLLEKYLEMNNLSRYLPELTSVLSAFFQGDVFSHDQMRFRDFVDDVEDYLEDLVREEKGDDDAVDDFEDYVFRHFFGDAAHRRSTKRDTFQRKDMEIDHQGGKVTIHPHKSSTASEPAGGRSSHNSASADEQSDRHNHRKQSRSKEEWSGPHNRKLPHFNQQHHRQERTKPLSEKDIPSNQHHKSHKGFNHKQNDKEEKSKRVGQEGGVEHNSKNYQRRTCDSPLPEVRMDYLKNAKASNHEDPPKEGRSSHDKGHKDFSDTDGRRDHEASKSFTTRKHHHKGRGEEKNRRTAKDGLSKD
uniref:Pre-B-cell leukemia transcription factor-interacting protein 1 isoform X2 n=1 Tax=Geotrypetes seraphini TaxID=260995 RepID=A0A6P8PYY1_GEOSA|nr:pre-B-cell leukemia transcription factor-interacting protein 1 isoform X2 [Geotrypetes seraphini]